MRAIKTLLLEEDDDINVIPRAILHQADIVMRLNKDNQQIELLKSRFSKRGVFYYLWDTKESLKEEE